MSATQCPCCNERKTVRCVRTMETFQYGVGETAVMLSAEVPMYVCDGCGFSYTDHEADEIRTAAINAHLAYVQGMREKI